MKKRLLSILMFLAFVTVTDAQVSPPFYASCVEAAQNVDCAIGIDGQQGSFPVSNQTGQPTGDCNMTVHNGVWISFVAGSANITLEIAAGACGPPPGGWGNCSTPGVQTALYSGCGPNYVLEQCGPGTGASNTPPNTTNNFFLAGLTVGGVYHLLLDGNCNALCDFTVNTVSGSTTPQPLSGLPVLQPTYDVCAGGTVTLSTTPVANAGDYTWTLPDGTVLTGQGPSITYTPGVFGPVSVTAGNGCDVTAPAFSVITEYIPPALVIDETDRCLVDGTYVYDGQQFFQTPLNINTIQTVQTTTTDALGCIQDVTIMLQYIDAPALSVSETICFGSVSQYGPYATDGIHTIQGFTAENCPQTTILDLTVVTPIAAINPGTSTLEINCLPPMTATLVAVPHTGQSGSTVTYDWNGPGNIIGDGNQTVMVDAGGTYTLTVTEIVSVTPTQANPSGQIICTSQFPSSIMVTESTGPPIATAVQNATIDCNLGSVQLDGTGSDMGTCFTYSWTNGAGMQVSTDLSPTISNATPGNYTLTVFNNCNNCFAMAQSVNVTGATASVAMATSDITTVDCNNTMATLDANGSSASATYIWSDATGVVGTGLTLQVGAGTYTLTVDNGSGCNASANPITISSNVATPTADITGNAPIDCNNNSVTLSGTGSTGSGTLTYSWQDASGTVLSTDPTYNTMNPGQVNLVVTDSGNGCVSTNPASVNITNNTSTVTVDITVTGSISCTSASVTLEATNISGASNPTYVWTDANGTVVGMMNPITVSAGTYTVVVTDGGTGCFGNNSETIVGNTDVPTAVATSTNNLDCGNTSTTLNATGSSTGANFTYEWFLSGVSVGSGISITVSEPGDYIVEVTNTDNNCNTPSSVLVSENTDTPTATITGSPNIDCNTPSVTLDGTSSTGTGTLSYSWQDASGMELSTASMYNTMNPGQVTLVVTDGGSGCASTNPASVTIVDNSSTVTFDITTTGSISCTSGSVTLEATSISGASNPTYEWTDANGMVVGTMNPITVGVGTYTVIVTDGGTGCFGDNVETIVGNTDAPTAMASSSNNIDCGNPSTTLSASGSSTGSNFTYEWFLSGVSVGSGISITVSDPGDYTVEVTNADNDCNTPSTIVSVVADNNTPTAVINGLAALDCNNSSSITLDGSGSTPSGSNTITSYEWLDGSGNVVGIMATLNVTNPGDYTLNIIQSNGCPSSPEMVTVIDNTTTVSVEATVSGMITCITGTVMLEAVNPLGTTNPTYEWFDAAGISVGIGASFSATIAGNYTVEITDVLSGCNNTATAIVSETMTLPAIDAVVANNQAITCDITSVSLDGSGSATGSNIEYTWTNTSGASVGQTALVNVSIAGTYTLTILDTSNGCTSTAMVDVVNDNTDPIADAGANGTLDCGPGGVILDGSSSTSGPNISYEWFNSTGAAVGTGITFNALSADDYTLVVTNTVTGCNSNSVASVMASIDVPNVGVSATNNGLITCEFNNLTLTGTSTTAGVNMEWQDTLGVVISTTPTLNVTTVGTYNFVVVDPTNGCPASTSVDVTEDMLPPAANAGMDPTLTCNDNFVTLNGSASTAGTNIEYEWFDAIGTSVGVGVTVDVMASGEYTLIVTNTDNGCDNTDIVEVFLDADIPVVVAINTNLDCINTTASLDGTGSTTGADIQYAWINAAGATVSTDLVAPVTDPGMYQLMITNLSNGCNSTSLFIEVEENTTVPTIAAANTTGLLTCTTLDATLDGTGSSTGTEFEYAWMDDMNNVLSPDISYDVTAPGTYFFQVTNMTNGCSVMSTPIIVDQDIVAPTAVVAGNATLTCTLDQATLDGTGSSTGTNFSYEWTDANDIVVGNAELITTVMNAGVYTLTVTNDDTGCQTPSASTVTILQDSNVPVAVIDTDVTANVLNCTNTSVLLDASNSTPLGSLTYEWIDEMGNVLGTAATIVVSDPGTVTLNIIDTNNSCDDSELFLILEDTNAPTALIDIPTTLDCANPMSTLDGSMSSTGANITYEWTDVNGIVLGADATLDTNVPGDFTLVVTNTDNGCSTPMTITLGDNFDAPAVDPGLGSTITCLDLTATLNGSGSASGPTITYEWTDENDMVVSTDLTNPNLDVTLPGEYTLTVFDSSNGCESTSLSAVTILENVDLPQAVAGMPQTITCTNDVLTLSGTGSDSGPDITYQWTDPSGNVSTDVILANVTEDGTYILEVTNATTGCVNTDDVVIGINIQAPTADAGDGGVLTCGTASFTLDASANSSMGADFTYQWLDANGVVVGTEVDFPAGAAGDYTFVVMDITNGCTNQDLVSVIEDLNSPQFDVMLSNDLLNCETQMITLDASNSSVNANSTGTLEFAWESPTGASLGATNSIDVSESGTYTLTITDDANGCFAIQPIIIGEDVEAPLAIVQAASNATLVCGQDSLLLDASSSTTGSTTGDLEYTWFDATGTEVGTGITFAATSAQVYTVEVLNTANGCTNQTTQAVLQDNNVPTLSAVVQGDLTCTVSTVIIDGSASTASGTGTLTYEWLDPNGTVVGTDPILLNATMEGAYTLTITDSDNMCSSTNTALTVVSNTNPPTALIDDINGTGQTLLCDVSSLVFDGANSFSASSATLTYAWTLNGNPIEITSNVEVSSAGTLMLTVTDTENGCSNNSSIIIDLDENVPAVIIATNAAAITCTNNAVTIDATASTAGLEYLWTGPGNITGETTLTPTVDASGQYTLTISNPNNGCDNSDFIMITSDTNPPAVVANAMDQFNCVITEITLSGDGSAIGSDFSYNWTGGVIVSGANTLNPVISAPGTYTLEVTNNLTGCTATNDVTVDADTDVPTATYVTNEPTCFGDTNGSFAVDIVTGGEGPYLYSIDGGNSFSTVDQFSFLGAGEYEVIVQDLNGCESTEIVSLDQPGELLVDLGGDITIQLGDPYTLDPQTIGGFDTIIWSNCDTCQMDTFQDLMPLQTSQYSVTLIDGNGCTATDRVIVSVEKKRDVYIPNVFVPNGGPNSVFMVYAGQEVAKVHEFRIFNRWGAQVFERKDFDPKAQSEDDGWDGRFNSQTMNPQVFVYYVDVEFIDGRREILRGDVALRR